MNRDPDDACLYETVQAGLDGTGVCVECDAPVSNPTAVGENAEKGEN